MIPEWVFMNPLPGYEMDRNKRLTAIYAKPIDIKAKTDFDWVYQNTRYFTRWLHKSVLKIGIANLPEVAALTTDTDEVPRVRVRVRQHPDSNGSVKIEPTRNPYIWYIKDDQYGSKPVGNVILEILVDKGPYGHGRALEVIKVRPLGDIDGSGKAPPRSAFKNVSARLSLYGSWKKPFKQVMLTKNGK